MITHDSAVFAPLAQAVGLDLPVPLLDGSTCRPINFDNAASSPALREVDATLQAFLPWYSSVHRGTGFKSRIATKAFEDAREIIRGFFGANPADHVVIFGKNATEAINKLAQRLAFQPGDVVLCSLLEHHSNMLPWRKATEVQLINCDAQGQLDEDHYRWLLERYAGRVRLVAVTGGSNVTGVRPPIGRLAAAAHAANAKIFVDCAQVAAHYPIQMGDLADPEHLDYIAISGHKMYAPFGGGALIGRRETFAAGQPEYVGGGSATRVTRDEITWSLPPNRDEAGSPNIIGAITMAAALHTLQRIGMETVAAHEAALTRYALQRLTEVPGLHLYCDSDPQRAEDRLAIFPFRLGELPHGLVAGILSTEWGIAVRNGSFCAQPYVRHLLGLSEQAVRCGRPEPEQPDAPTAGLIRASFGIYTTSDEIDRFVDALQMIARGEYQGNYSYEPALGEYQAQGWTPDMDAYFSLHQSYGRETI